MKKGKNKKYRIILFILTMVVLNYISCYRDLDEEEIIAVPVIPHPTNLRVLSAYDGTVILQWLAGNEKILGFNIYSSISSNAYSFNRIGTTNFLTYTIKNLSYDTTYYFFVKSYNDASESDASEIVNAKASNIYAPRRPQSLVVLGSNSDNKKRMILTWYPNTEGDMARYYIAKSGDEGSAAAEYLLIGETVKNIYIDSLNLIEGQKYFYIVTAMDKGGLPSPPSYAESDYILQKPKLLLPQNDAVITSRLDFRWLKVNNASSYIFIINSSPFANEIFRREITSSADTNIISYNSGEMVRGITYYWKVLTVTKSSSNPNSSSETRSFYYYPESK